MADENENLPTVLPTSNLQIAFPATSQNIDLEDGEKTRALIKETSAYTPDGSAFINKEAMPHLLATDKKGVNRIYNDLDNEDKLELGEKKLLSVPAVSKELSKRIQEPRDPIERERLRDSEACVIALRDAPALEQMRVLDEAKNRREQPLLKRKKIKAEQITACQVTGQPLQPNAHAHHIERRADKPRKARNLDNIIVVNPEPHQEIHRQGAESPEDLQKLCAQKGWINPLAENPDGDSE